MQISLYADKRHRIKVVYKECKTSVSPRSSPMGTFRAETSPAAKSEEKRMFSQAKGAWERILQAMRESRGSGPFRALLFSFLALS